VRRVSGKKEPAVLHGLRDHTVHPRNRLLDDGTFGERESVVRLEPQVELLPDAIVRPIVDRVAAIALHIETRERGRAHAQERESTFV
jgi:hypothetical protein